MREVQRVFISHQRGDSEIAKETSEIVASFGTELRIAASKTSSSPVWMG